MTKTQRKWELNSLARSNGGKGKLVSLFKKAKGIPDGTTPIDILGMTNAEIIDEILAHEFPETAPAK